MITYPPAIAGGTDKTKQTSFILCLLLLLLLALFLLARVLVGATVFSSLCFLSLFIDFTHFPFRFADKHRHKDKVFSTVFCVYKNRSAKNVLVNRRSIIFCMRIYFHFLLVKLSQFCVILHSLLFMQPVNKSISSVFYNNSEKKKCLFEILFVIFVRSH